MIIINGQVFEGDNLSVSNSKIMIDGKDVTIDGYSTTKNITITIDSPVNNVSLTAGTITVNSDAGTVSTTSGDINVSGNIKGSVSTISGDVRATSIGGSVSTISGDISR